MNAKIIPFPRTYQATLISRSGSYTLVSVPAKSIEQAVALLSSRYPHHRVEVH